MSASLDTIISLQQEVTKLREIIEKIKNEDCRWHGAIIDMMEEAGL